MTAAAQSRVGRVDRLFPAESLNSRRHDVVFSRRHQIYRQGDPAEHVYLIASGKVKLSRQTRHSYEKVLAVLGSSDIFGEIAVLDPAPRTANATALTEVHASVVHRDDLRELMAGRPEIAERLLRVLAQRLRSSSEHQLELATADVAGRVARQLMLLARRFGVRDDAGLRVTHDMTQTELAQLVGASREAVNRCLGEFETRGWIRVDGKSVSICNPRAVARRAR
jgi:CRP-like cAMP-binding protein